MASPKRLFDIYIPGRPIYSRARFLPASEVQGAHLDHTLLADGCRVAEADIRDAVIGLRSLIGPKTQIRSSIIMGADYYETEVNRAENKRLGRPEIGIGEGTVIEGAIVDKNARIGRNVHIRHIPNRSDSETDNWVARDDLVFIPKDAAIDDDTVI